MLKPSKCEPQTQNIYDAKGPTCYEPRPHTSIYQKAQESIKLKAPKLWTWRKLTNSENLKPKFKKTKPYLLLQSWKPLQKIWIWNLKKIILEAQKSITFKTKKTMNIGATKSINNEVQKSRCLERYTPQSVWTKKT